MTAKLILQGLKMLGTLIGSPIFIKIYKMIRQKASKEKDWLATLIVCFIFQAILTGVASFFMCRYIKEAINDLQATFLVESDNITIERGEFVADVKNALKDSNYNEPFLIGSVKLVDGVGQLHIRSLKLYDNLWSSPKDLLESDSIVGKDGRFKSERSGYDKLTTIPTVPKEEYQRNLKICRELYTLIIEKIQARRKLGLSPWIGMTQSELTKCSSVNGIFRSAKSTPFEYIYIARNFSAKYAFNILGVNSKIDI